MANVYIVGAGPGHPELLTLRAHAVLKRADVCLYDRLISSETLALLPPDCEKIDVGKAPGVAHRMRQEDIQALMLKYARQNKVVLRLKGGDPYVFGRGAEEAKACFDAGVSFEVVPGLTSALTAASFAGIPMTHRQAGAEFAVITAHRREDQADHHPLKWPVLAQLDTLVILMGVSMLSEICRELIAHGKAPDTPAALVSQGTLIKQKTVVATLSTLVERCEKSGIQAPAIVVVGDVVRYTKTLCWFERLPLFGKTVWVTRASQQSSELSERLRECGAQVLETPVIEIKPTQESLEPLFESLRHVDWLLFTSANGAEIFLNQLFGSGRDARSLAGVKIGVIGKSTADCLQKYGLSPDVVPREQFQAEGLLAALPEDLTGRQVILARAKKARSLLPEKLSARGALVSMVDLYETLPAENLALRDLWKTAPPDFVTFTSASTVEHFSALLRKQGLDSQSIQGISIGPITSEAAEKHQIKIVAQASEATMDALVKVLLQFVKGQG